MKLLTVTAAILLTQVLANPAQAAKGTYEQEKEKWQKIVDQQLPPKENDTSKAEKEITQNLLKMFSPDKVTKPKEGLYEVSGYRSDKPNIECSLTFGSNSKSYYGRYTVRVKSKDQQTDRGVELIDSEVNDIVYVNSLTTTFKGALRIKQNFTYSIDSNLINISYNHSRKLYKRGLVGEKYSPRHSDEELSALRIENQGNYVSVAHNGARKTFNRSGIVTVSGDWSTPSCLFDAK